MEASNKFASVQERKDEQWESPDPPADPIAVGSVIDMDAAGAADHRALTNDIMIGRHAARDQPLR